ncbi:14465_t:CDS:1, partial [Racocetra persica]
GGFSYKPKADPPEPVNGTFNSETFEYTIKETSGAIFFISDVLERCENGMFGMVTIVSGSPTANSNDSSPTSQNALSSNSPGASNSKSTASTTYANAFTFA